MCVGVSHRYQLTGFIDFTDYINYFTLYVCVFAYCSVSYLDFLDSGITPFLNLISASLLCKFGFQSNRFRKTRLERGLPLNCKELQRKSRNCRCVTCVLMCCVSVCVCSATVVSLKYAQSHGYWLCLKVIDLVIVKVNIVQRFVGLK